MDLIKKAGKDLKLEKKGSGCCKLVKPEEVLQVQLNVRVRRH